MIANRAKEASVWGSFHPELICAQRWSFLGRGYENCFFWDCQCLCETLSVSVIWNVFFIESLWNKSKEAGCGT